MSVARLHRRLAVGMGLAGLVAFAGGAAIDPLPGILAGAALVLALFWQPSPERSAVLERVWLPIAIVLVVRAFVHAFFLDGDVVVPVVDLLLLLLAAEALRSLDSPNDLRLYALSFALLLAATAYRPGVLFAVAFVAYLMIATVALTVGHLKRKAARYDVDRPRVGRAFLGGTAALSLVVLAVSFFVFLTFPRVSRAWNGRGRTTATSVAGFSDRISLGEHGATIRANPEVVLRVEFPRGAPENVGSLRWRGRSYDHFDGARWSRSPQVGSSAVPGAWYGAWGDSTVLQRVYSAPLDVRVLFGLHPVLNIDPRSRIRPEVDPRGNYTYWGNAQPVYDVVSVAARPPADSLRAASAGFMPDRERYLQLPRMRDAVHTLADSLTRGLESRYDRAVAIERWLHDFDYTTQLPATAREATLEHFLFERRAGHCEYFSTAMVVLLRTLGIQARNVNGFLGGRWSGFGEYLVVTQNEAHSWVEVWFPGYGWVPFDPTPPASATREVADAWSWPGRFLFDGLQHRWNKWILDYDIGVQIGLLDGLFGSDRESAAPSPDASSGSGGLPWPWIVAALLFALLAGTLLLSRVERALPRESRLYRSLVGACRDAGVVPDAPVTAVELVDRLDRSGHPATPFARRLVELYLVSRFGAAKLDAGERAAMREALAEARRTLRGAAP